MHNLSQHAHTDSADVIKRLTDCGKVRTSETSYLRIITGNDLKIFWNLDALIRQTI